MTCLHVCHLGRTVFFTLASIGLTHCDRSYGEATARRPDLVLITIDTLRADRLPLNGYRAIKTPCLDALVQDAVVFDEAVAHAPITLPSHASIMTGLYPPQHGLRDNGGFFAPDSLITLAELLEDSGYQTAAFVSAFVLDSRFGLDQGFEIYDDDLIDGRPPPSKFGVKDRRAETTVSASLDWLEVATRSPEPFFMWIHLYDPHYTYAPPEPFRSRYRDPYDGEIAYTDQELGRLISALKRKGRYRDALVIVTADHGESLGDHGESTHSIFIYESTQWVPLIMKFPRSEYRGLRVPNVVRHIDIMPTVLHALAPSQLPTGWSDDLPGRSLLRLLAGQDTERAPPSYAEAYLPRHQFGWSALYSLRNERYKFIEAPTPELYDLANDMKEQRNIAATVQDLVIDLRAQLQELKAALGETTSTNTVRSMDRETERKLQALGYVSTAPPSVATAGKDPKEMIWQHELRTRAHRLLNQEFHAQAIPILRSLVARDPTNPTAYSELAAAYGDLGWWDEAEAAYLRALKLAPDRAEFHAGLAKVYFKSRRNFAGAAREIQTAFAITPEDPALWTLSGDFLHEQGRLDEAIVAYAKAVDAGSQDAPLLVGYASALNLRGNVERAREVIESAIRSDPTNDVAHYNHGVILERQDALLLAESAYRESLRLEPHNHLAWGNLGNVLVRQGSLEEAINAFQRALSIEPKDARTLYNLGSLHLGHGRPQQAVYALAEAVALQPEDPGSRTNLGYAYEQLGRLEEAFSHYQRLTEIYPATTPGHVDAWLRLARIREAQGLGDEAMDYRRTALERTGCALVGWGWGKRAMKVKSLGRR